MSFDEVQFPTDVSRGATSRPKRLVDVVTMRSGYEQRNTIWANSRRSYDVGIGLQSLDDVYSVLEFWEARRGRLRGFRFKDWSDFKSCAPNGTVAPTDQALGTGDGTTTDFQLVKTYSSASNPWTRDVTKPVDGTTRVALDGTEVYGFSVDTTTGVVTIDGAGGSFSLDFLADTYYLNVVPQSGEAVTAGFEFDVPVRFEEEEIEINVALFTAGSIPDITLVEVRG